MTSETRIAYGSLVLRQGRSRPFAWYQAKSSRFSRFTTRTLVMSSFLDMKMELCQASLTVQNDVRSLRASRDLSQAALGKALGVSRQTINAIETGRYLPSLPLAFDLARFFATPIEAIFHPSSEEGTP